MSPSIVLSPSISVVIVNYNNSQYLSDCLESIYKSTLKDFEVVVIDNHSTDKNVLDVEKKFPRSRFIFLERNQGFASGTNIGILQSKGKYIFLLNNDTVISRYGWAGIDNIFEADQQLAAIQPKISIEGTAQVNNCGLEVNYLGFSWDRNYQASISEETPPIELAAFSGAAVVLRRSALENVGLFDEGYFMYHEDVDLSCRLRLQGHRIKLIPDLLVSHHYTYKRNNTRYFFLERNRWYTIIKDWPVLLIIAILPPLVIMEIGMLFHSLINRWFLKKLRSNVECLIRFPSLIRLRHQYRREISIRQFITPMTGVITFREIRNPLLDKIANPILGWYWMILTKLLGIHPNRKSPIH